MPDRPTAWMSWSSGKDSAFALHEVLTAGELEVTGLLTTLVDGRVTAHGVRRELVQAQADALGLPLHVVDLPPRCGNAEYEARTGAAVAHAREQGVGELVFGDLHLADVRAYREAALAGSGVTPRFPLWGRPTGALAEQVQQAGIRAVLTCVDPSQLPAALCGRWYDAQLLADLPAGADPCGENGEFHTFVAASPDFAAEVDVRVGAVEERDGFVLADLLAR